jgi:hypothetical protein
MNRKEIAIKDLIILLFISYFNNSSKNKSKHSLKIAIL